MGRPRKHPVAETKPETGDMDNWTPEPETEVVFEATPPAVEPAPEPAALVIPSKDKFSDLQARCVPYMQRGLVLTPDADGMTFARGLMQEWCHKSVPMEVMVRIAARVSGV